jgi:hypothetical protein
MKFIANYAGKTYDENGNMTLSFSVTGEENKKASECVQFVEGKLASRIQCFTVEVDTIHKKRSPNANAYFHLLIDRIAKEMNLGADETKKRFVLEYGTILTMENGKPFGIKIPKGANPTIVYPYAKWFDTRLDKEIEFDCYIIYKATHEYNSKEMARLIEGVIWEAQELGIETITPKEKEIMLGRWKSE